MSMGGGGGGTTTVQQADPWVGLQPYLNDLYGRSQGLSYNPQQYYPGQTYANWNPYQIDAMAGLLGYAGVGAGQSILQGNPVNTYNYSQGQYPTGQSPTGQYALNPSGAASTDGTWAGMYNTILGTVGQITPPGEPGQAPTGGAVRVFPSTQPGYSIHDVPVQQPVNGVIPPPPGTSLIAGSTTPIDTTTGQPISAQNPLLWGSNTPMSNANGVNMPVTGATVQSPAGMTLPQMIAAAQNSWSNQLTQSPTQTQQAAGALAPQLSQSLSGLMQGGGIAGNISAPQVNVGGGGTPAAPPPGYSYIPSLGKYLDQNGNEYTPGGNNFNPTTPQIGFTPNTPQANANISTPNIGFNVNTPQVGFNPSSPQSNYNYTTPNIGFNVNTPQVDFNPTAPQIGYNPVAPQVDYNPVAPQNNFKAQVPTIDFNPTTPQIAGTNFNLPTNTLEQMMSGQIDTNVYNQLADAMQGRMTRAFTQDILPNIRDEGILTGAYGGSRQDLANQGAVDIYSQNVGDALSALYGGAYNTAMNQRQAGASLATQAGLTVGQTEAQRNLAQAQFGMDTQQIAANLAAHQADLGMQGQNLDAQAAAQNANLGMTTQQLAAQIAQYNAGLGMQNNQLQGQLATAQAGLDMDTQNLMAQIAQYNAGLGMQGQQLGADLAVRQAMLDQNTQQMAGQQSQFNAGMDQTTQQLAAQIAQYNAGLGMQGQQLGAQLATQQAGYDLQAQNLASQLAQFNAGLNLDTQQLQGQLATAQAGLGMDTQQLAAQIAQQNANLGLSREQLAASVGGQNADRIMQAQQLAQAGRIAEADAMLRGAGLSTDILNAAGQQQISQGQLGNSALALAPMMQQLGMAPYDILNSVGSSLQGQQQMAINEAVNRYNFNQQAPWDALSNYTAALGGVPMGAFGNTSTTSSTQADPMSAALGTGMTTAGLYSMGIMNPTWAIGLPILSYLMS